MTVLRGFFIVGVSAAACALFGAAVGYFLGEYAPWYYRGTCPNGSYPGFDPVEVGVGLGLTQGLVVGVLVGCVVVLAASWSNARRQVVLVDAATLAARAGVTVPSVSAGHVTETAPPPRDFAAPLPARHAASAWRKFPARWR